MESPTWVPIDLDYVPHGQLSPNEIKLADIEKQILDARAEAKAAAAAADRNRVQAARSTVKQLKQEKKRLEAAIEEDKNNEQSTRSDMAAEVEELQRKISAAQAKATEAEEKDDEEAEEAAYEEMDKLLAQLEMLKQGKPTPTSKSETSKTKQRLEEAKHIDAEVCSLEDLRSKLIRRVEEDGHNLGLNAIVTLDFDGAGYIYIDAKSEPNVISGENKCENIDCIVKLSFDVLKQIKDGKTDAMTMMGEGKITIEGNMMIGIKGLQCIQNFM